MSEYADYELGIDEELADLAPEAQAEPDISASYIPGVTGEQMVAAGVAFLDTPAAREYMAAQQQADQMAAQQEAAPAIHSHLDAVEGRLGVTLDRRAVIDLAEEYVPAMVKEFGPTVEAAEKAMELAARKLSGRETYDDIIMRRTAGLRK